MVTQVYGLLFKNHAKYFVIIFLAITLFCSHSLAQSPYFNTHKLFKNKRQYTIESIFQDSYGCLWIGTSEGLCYFNGVETKTFTASDSILSSTVTAIAQDNSGKMWFGFKNGKIQYLEQGRLFNFNPEEGLGTATISCMYFDPNGTLYYGTLGEGLYYYTGINRKRLYNINSDDGLNDNFLYTLTIGEDSTLFLGTDNGIAILNINTHKLSGVISMKNGLPDNIVKKIIYDKNKLWIGMEDAGICCYDIRNNSFKTLIDWQYGTLNGFIKRSDNEFWISTKENGLIRIINENNTYTAKQFLNAHLGTNKLSQVYLDREMNVWAGGDQGLIKSCSSAFEFFDKRDGFSYPNIYSFLVDSKDRYWAASDEGLVRITKDKSGKYHQKFLNASGLHKGIAIVSLFEDYKGFIWAGTYGNGALKINPDDMSCIMFSTRNHLPDNNVMSISGEGRNIWLATLGGGAVRLNIEDNSKKIYSEKNGLGSNYLYSVFCDSKGRVWFGQDGQGISLLENGTLKNNILHNHAKIDINTIYGFAEDKDKNIWCLTSDIGLVVINKDGKYSFFNETNGLLTNNVRSITSDKYGNIVIASNNGIQYYNTKSHSFATFAEENGVAYLEPNLNAVSSDKNGNIWLSCQNSVVKLNPSNLQESSITPLINITRKLLFFNEIKTNETDFSYKQNHLSFEYIGVWLQSPENIKYRYKLENYDVVWSQPTTSRLATYSSLPPGNYTFKVEVSHIPGIWITNAGASYSFQISPPFYKTWWFITLTIITIGASIVYYVKARTAKLIKAKEALEEEVVKRTATILQQKEEIETQRDEIEAQRDFVIKQRDKIAHQNEHITSSIQYASRIQRAVFVPEEVFELRLRNYFILNRPMEIVSGDFYWIAGKKERTFVAVADCTGHGVPGAFMSVLGISLLNKIASSSPNVNAAEFLNILRDEVKYSLRQTGKTGEAQDGMDISLVIINYNDHNFDYAGANNPLYIIRNKELIIYKPDKMPIGIFVEEHPFTNNKGTFEKDDMVYLFSDGYSDQFGGKIDRKFKSNRFQELLINICHLPLDEQQKHLNEAMDEWKSGTPQNDDILVVGFKI